MTTATTIFQSAKELNAYRNALKEKRSGKERSIRVCIGTGCQAKGSLDVLKMFQRAVRESDKSDIRIETKFTGCHGLCELGPIVIIDPGEIIYLRVQPHDVAEIFRETVLLGHMVERFLYQKEAEGARYKTPHEIPFYNLQKRIVLALNGVIDPTSIDDYIAHDGYEALAQVLTTYKSEEIIEMIERSQLRGRGGGGFLTGRKWRTCVQTGRSPRYVICNGDEGDPGAFMDRSIMEGNPHAVLEGMIIGAYAIGAQEGFIYVRHEYPLAVKHLQMAIDQAREIGLLGESILGTDFNFDVTINRGGGAFICGESTALMASLEGRVGEPRAKYVHTVEYGLYDCPTTLNNVETWATIPAIVRNGPEWFTSIGTERSKGTKVFSLVGKVNNTGLVEVPMGMTLKEIIYGIGDGVKGGRPFKAVQTGGPSGGCLPESLINLPVDFDRLTEAGSMMGSGGMIVMDDSTCMVNVAKYFLDFLKQESCGKCTPCREGIAQMLHILTRLTKGKGEEGDIERLEALGELLADASLCALGKSAANPVLSTLRYFREEYEEHIRKKHCPALECPGLFRYEIVAELCKGCGICLKKCPMDAITGEKKKAHTIDQEKCTQCGACFSKCPFTAIKKI
ncbi:MAG: NADH-ubiquinone oxidoreductase-F iron-sulfur binding region domain-containing protein [bacterium]